MAITASGGGIRMRREGLGLTRVQLAAQTGVSVTYIAQLEAGALPRYHSDALDRIADVLGTSAKQLSEEASPA